MNEYLSPMRLIPAVLLMVLCSAAAPAGEVYKWVDKNGKVHYGDRPKHEAEPVELKPLSGIGPAPAGEVSEEQAARAEECARKQKLLAAYKDAPTITETDSLGNARDFTEEQRKQLIAKAEQLVQEACSEPVAAKP